MFNNVATDHAPELINGNAEFFCGSAIKTPDRYLRIRNAIVDLWQKQRPQYLSKTTARKQIKAGGDVNVIGRVHEFLERFGAINVGASAAPGKSPKPAPTAPRLRKPARPRLPTPSAESSVPPTGLAR